MRSHIVFSACIALVAASCARSSGERHYRLQGQVLEVTPNHQEATIKHEEIKGLMPAMTMPYKVQDAALLDGVVPGDLITATLVIVSNDAYLTRVKKVGQAPLARPASSASSASTGFELLKPGDAVPTTGFVDQEGTTRDFASFKGSTVALTFIYTRCPLPTFCPLMDRHFATVQKRLREEPAPGGGVHLVTISFDPATDTPAVLKKHAKTLGADLRTWTFLTGDRDEIDRFAARFGVSIARALTDARDVTHNLRTAIVDAEGRLVKVYTGNEWTPEQLLADLTR